MTTTPVIAPVTNAPPISWMSILQTFLSKLLSSLKFGDVVLGASNLTLSINQQGFLFNVGLNNFGSSMGLGSSNQSLILKNLAKRN